MKKVKTFRVLLLPVSLMISMLACNFVTDALKPSGTTPPAIVPSPANTITPEIIEVTEVELPTEIPTAVDFEVEETEETLDLPGLSMPIPEGEIGVSALRPYQDEWESWIVSGLVYNNTDRAVDSLEIEVEAIDPNGKSLFKEIAYGDLYSIAPGETSTFTLWVWEELPVDTEFTASIVGFSSTELERAELEFRGMMMTFGDGYVNVTGDVVNNNDFPVDFNDLAVATFTAEGELMTAGADDVSLSYLLPGESGPFRVSMDAPGIGLEAIVDFKVYSNAEVGSVEDIHALTFIEETDYIDSDGDFHLVGEIQNNSNLFLNPDLVAAIYDIEGNVLDASNVDMPLYSLGPGEQTVFDFYSWNPINSTPGLIDQADSYEIKVDWGWTWETDTRYIDLSINDSGYEYDSFWGLTFIGSVTNNTVGEVDGGKVIIVLRNQESGKIIAMGYETLFDVISVSGSVEYSVLVEVKDDINLEEIEYSIIAKGEIP